MSENLSVLRDGQAPVGVAFSNSNHVRSDVTRMYITANAHESREQSPCHPAAIWRMADSQTGF
jgi:hypothetical protein